ncbi:bifunctional [glutamine synthetase] adenylyltransferase/[glutamine synthetase]-adenylyl-L-tyrosine phosphorylase [Streptomonospora nanhaiensis]|uniref:Bifunctional glutamine synthetase adenylyltransferase/adenylyl-removing enzyme n=1 Tax=Streptomonospora nanhaiensis TaxID=1323731 RepID=A0A853BJV1_9ACTN|nr:bifunctional [glutamine synthetase] adenylyltransferase/[glutamine synthetase]-adenylyl-L-tyrosine phosphorylase [Streptomonospora nanhaiensis]MBV2362360.1 bifunctional [glutamine synthetase] adenylyltransferase/[glutamine synthetase]-adenylyl-L-tyrosine phosphorylase [Streptomonospora nanhaiensis]MBX9391806.1 bifunctional [glutamine synthetase] adenylyltransferase/[glutamine synthetase]-adenylyl-L-tyrosine phosphorylase [Streptomonospora nanhaiensis]NYI94984.1 glutamate-ammonia-ligase adenyl
MTAGGLARRGFGDASRAVRLMGECGLDAARHAAVVDALGAAPDPDQALLGLVRLLETGSEAAELLEALTADPDLRARLAGVLGASVALTDHLVRHPGDWRELRGADAARTPTAEELRAGLLHIVGADPHAAAPVAAPECDDPEGPEHALRVAYHRRVLRLAGRDLTGAADLETVGAELADLAAAVLEAALAIARSRAPAEAALCRLAVIGMGKCGGRELNYVSDVDVVFVAEPAEGVEDDQAAQRAAARLAAEMMRIPAETDSEGTLWQVDAALRPEGRNGPLVRPLSGHVAYYQRWAKTWEFQALLKARPVAGDPELGAAYLAEIEPLVWKAASRPNFVDDVQAMRRRVVAHIPAAEAEREIKLGRGGLRDIEFSVQLLQLVHGRSDPALRSGNTLEALAALSGGGYVGREDAGGLADAYRFLRRVEHLLQLSRLRRTHLLPDPAGADGPDQLRRLGRALGFTANPVTDLMAAWRRVAGEVRRLHEKLFYRPLLHAVARLPDSEARLTLEQAGERLSALGFADSAGALRHLEALTSGLSRRAAIQRTLLPVMLEWFADAPDPDAGLLGFRQVSEALGGTPWYLRLLRDDVRVAERMAWLLGTSRYVTELLLRAPESVAVLADDADLAARPVAALMAEADAALRRHDSAENAVAAVRALRRRELLRTAVADLLDVAPVDAVGEALTDISAVTIEAALRAASDVVAAQRGEELCTRLCVVAMGRFGGRELSYASDADVLFVHEPLPGADPVAATETAGALVRELRRLLEMPAVDPPLRLDADLRPEGKSGAMVRTLDSYAAYYRRWSSPWESQALLRAFPIAGDPGVGARFTALVDPLRYPEGGVDERAVREIRTLKARMEAERLPRGADPALHTKLGRGGLSDVEWVAQLLQLRHAARVPALRTTGTLKALDAAVDHGLLDPDDGAVLETAWRLAARVRGAVMLVRGRPSDSVPTSLRDQTTLAGALGYREEDDEGPAGQLLQDYRQATRRARAVMERVFYDD